jgi:hypothetical protein
MVSTPTTATFSEERPQTAVMTNSESSVLENAPPDFSAQEEAVLVRKGQRVHTQFRCFLFRRVT